MTVENHIDPEGDDGRHQEIGRLPEDQVILGLIVTVIDIFQILRLRVFILVHTEQDQHAAGCYEKHTGLAEGIESTVIKDHAGNDIDCTCLIEALLNITERDFIVLRRIRITEGRQIVNSPEQENDHKNGRNHTEDILELLISSDTFLKAGLIHAVFYTFFAVEEDLPFLNLRVIEDLPVCSLHFEFAGNRVILSLHEAEEFIGKTAGEFRIRFTHLPFPPPQLYVLNGSS